MDFSIFLSFSDAAKFADIARNLVQGDGYGASFKFFGKILSSQFTGLTFATPWTLPITPFSMAAFFKIFGVSDFAVVATSFFYFILTLIFVFLLARKVFRSNLVGILSALVVGFNNDLINYAVSGASESPFIFEIVVATYFASLKKGWATVLMALSMVLMYFTRPMAFIYIAGIILFWLLLNFGIKKAVIYFVGVLVAGFLFDHFVLLPLSGKFFLYSITARGINSALAQTTSTIASDALRGNSIGSFDGGGMVQVAKNIFYNLYNFYKLLPQIVNPYLFALFVIGMFIKTKNQIEGSFRITNIFIVAITFLMVAASIPFLRYIHPVVPLIYVMAVGTLVEIINYQFSKRMVVILVSSFIILLFGVGQTLGIIFLDSRFERNTHNVGKPPVYVQLSYLLRDNTNKNQIIVTNLDTWGSWYGERTTVWFPLEPKQLINSETGKIPFDAIYLTSYLIDDENYYMSKGWRMIFENPMNSKKWICDGCSEIAKEFTLKGVYSVPASDDYEKEDAKAILLIKNN